jgi:hypothetical protein
MGIKDRIDEFINYKCLNIKAFEHEIGISNGLWSKAKTISEEVLLKVIARYPELNSDWLLKGTGGMFAHGGIENDEIELLREENTNLNKELERLKTLKLPTKDSKVYNLWMKFMDITSEMQGLYKEEKEK